MEKAEEVTVSANSNQLSLKDNLTSIFFKENNLKQRFIESSKRQNEFQLLFMWNIVIFKENYISRG